MRKIDNYNTTFGNNSGKFVAGTVRSVKKTKPSIPAQYVFGPARTEPNHGHHSLSPAQYAAMECAEKSRNSLPGLKKLLSERSVLE
jgi:hypothetical protein